MVAGCGNKCIKYTFFFFNFLFFVFGALILALALWARFDNEFQQRLGNILTDAHLTTNVQLSQMYVALYVLAGIGAVLFLLGFLGCCGACCEQICVLGLFFSVVLALFCLEIAAGVYIFVKKDTIKEDFADWYRRELSGRYNDNEEIRRQLDSLQEQLKCCGARGCDEYTVSPAPASCKCVPGVNGTGCAYKLFDAVASNLLVVGIVAISILAIELMAMIFSCVLCSAIRNAHAYDYY